MGIYVAMYSSDDSTLVLFCSVRSPAFCQVNLRKWMACFAELLMVAFACNVNLQFQINSPWKILKQKFKNKELDKKCPFDMGLSLF